MTNVHFLTLSNKKQNEMSICLDCGFEFENLRVPANYLSALCIGIGKGLLRPVMVQPSGWRLGMNCRPKHPRFDPPLGVPLDYLI